MQIIIISTAGTTDQTHYKRGPQKRLLPAFKKKRVYGYWKADHIANGYELGSDQCRYSAVLLFEDSKHSEHWKDITNI